MLFQMCRLQRLLQIVNVAKTPHFVGIITVEAEEVAGENADQSCRWRAPRQARPLTTDITESTDGKSAVSSWQLAARSDSKLQTVN
jgi:hypothetical protein